MKAKKKQKSHASHRRSATKPTRASRETMQTSPSELHALPSTEGQRSAHENGGPLNQEGEGNRQNDQQAELEGIEPDLQ